MADPRVHGGLVAAELAAAGVDPARVLDFSVNVNPYGPAPQMRAAIAAAPIERYPDPTAAPARQALARALDVEPDRIVVGNGAAELLWGLARALVPPGEPALVVEPAFSEFAAAVAACGGRPAAWRARPEEAFAIRVDEVAGAARHAGARAVYLATPANPTGTPTPPDAVAALAAAIAPATLVLDEAFLSLGERHLDARAPLPPSVVRVRSLTKEHAIPGVRVGYLIAPPPLAATLEAGRPPWSAGAAAQAAAIASVGLQAFVADSRARLIADRAALAEGLAGLGLRAYPSAAPYLLVPFPGSASARRALLARAGILVRDCASFGLPDHLRLAARPAADRDRLLSALRLLPA